MNLKWNHITRQWEAIDPPTCPRCGRIVVSILDDFETAMKRYQHQAEPGQEPSACWVRNTDRTT